MVLNNSQRVYALFDDPATKNASYSVSPSGNDSNIGTSATSPFTSIAAASARVKPGDIVYLLKGNFSEAMRPAVSGSENNPIT